MLQAADAVDTAAAAADTVAAEPHGRAEAAAPFPRPRGRGPPGCTWDVLKGAWFRAHGSAWQKVRNEKRELARAARRWGVHAPEGAKHRCTGENGLFLVTLIQVPCRAPNSNAKPVLDVSRESLQL